MAKGAYIGVDGVARKIKNGYIGVETEFPIYEEQEMTVNITENNITDMFDVTNGSLYFVGSNGVFTTNNGGVTNSSATTTLTAKYDITISFSYSYSSETGYDKFTLKVAGTTVENAVSGATTTKEYTGALAKGQTIEFTYAKDNSSDKNDDKCTFFNMVASGIVTTQVGTEVKSIARKIKKAYIGIGGVARPCWSSGELAYYGTITALSAARRNLAAATIGNYALFAGGSYNNGSTTNDLAVVDAYDQSLTRSIPTSLRKGRSNLAATTVGNYALFGGGENGSGTRGEVDAYDQSLTRRTLTTLISARSRLAATTVGNYALFAGGGSAESASSHYVQSYVDAYDQSLTRSTPTELTSKSGVTNGTRNLAAATVGNYALFAGGVDGAGGNSSVHAYDQSLTQSNPEDIFDAMVPGGRGYLAATTVGNYALFGGGCNPDNYYSQVVDAYDQSLTRSTPTELYEKKAYLTATTVGNYALFAGGQKRYYSKQYIVSSVDAYDSSLVQSSPNTLISPRSHLTATTVGNYALFGGGIGNTDLTLEDSYLNTVEAYTLT